MNASEIRDRILPWHNCALASRMAYHNLAACFGAQPESAVATALSAPIDGWRRELEKAVGDRDEWLMYWQDECGLGVTPRRVMTGRQEMLLTNIDELACLIAWSRAEA